MQWLSNFGAKTSLSLSIQRIIHMAVLLGCRTLKEIRLSCGSRSTRRMADAFPNSVVALATGNCPLNLDKTAEAEKFHEGLTCGT